ncbi:MAG: toxic anion resistance protein [Spirochaetes bacterium]|nr:toxic anion resistance protein [Spirochaetota bacterium]
MENQPANLPAVNSKETAVADLNEQQKKRLDEIMNGIDIADTQNVIQYGVGAQSNISSFSDSILQNIRSKDSGEIGQVLSDLMFKVKSVDVGSITSSDSFLSKIPILSSLVDSAKKFVASYEKMSVHIERIVDELTKARMQLLKDISMFDTMYEKNLEYFKELELYILAGKIKKKEIEEKIIPELKAKADTSSDSLDAQRVQDMTQLVNRFEKKIYDLQLSRMISLQTAPQVRLIQNNDQLLVEKIQSSILNTIPLWKNQIVIAIGLFRQKKALEMQKEVTKTTNDLLVKNAELLKTGSIEVAKESEKGIVELETLKKVHENLLATIEETLKIQEEGKAKRIEAEKELVKLEDELKQKLKATKSSEPSSIKL